MKKFTIIIIIILAIGLIPLGINFYIILTNRNNIYQETEITEKYDIALVLGCSVLKDGTPSKMLKDRLNTAIYLYKENLVKKILVSGDHNNSYSEVDSMYNYLLENDILESDILRDNIGYSTGESLSNYYTNYKDESIIIVTQKYHLYRALNIAKSYDLEAIGVHAKLIQYHGQFFREVREILARNKDYVLYNFFK